jgi:hypothetical protein
MRRSRGAWPQRSHSLISACSIISSSASRSRALPSWDCSKGLARRRAHRIIASCDAMSPAVLFYRQPVGILLRCAPSAYASARLSAGVAPLPLVRGAASMSSMLQARGTCASGALGRIGFNTRSAPAPPASDLKRPGLGRRSPVHTPPYLRAAPGRAPRCGDSFLLGLRAPRSVDLRCDREGAGASDPNSAPVAPAASVTSGAEHPGSVARASTLSLPPHLKRERKKAPAPGPALVTLPNAG